MQQLVLDFLSMTHFQVHFADYFFNELLLLACCMRIRKIPEKILYRMSYYTSYLDKIRYFVETYCNTDLAIVLGKCVAQRENVHHSKVSYIQLLNERYIMGTVPVLLFFHPTSPNNTVLYRKYSIFTV